MVCSKEHIRITSNIIDVIQNKAKGLSQDCYWVSNKSSCYSVTIHQILLALQLILDLVGIGVIIIIIIIMVD